MIQIELLRVACCFHVATITLESPVVCWIYPIRTGFVWCTETLKLELWKKFEFNRDGYTDAKSVFVREILSKVNS